MTDHTAREVAARAIHDFHNCNVDWAKEPEALKQWHRQSAQAALDAIGYEEAASILHELMTTTVDTPDVDELTRPQLAEALLDSAVILKPVFDRARTWVSHHPAAKSVSAHPVEEA